MSHAYRDFVIMIGAMGGITTTVEAMSSPIVLRLEH